MKRSLMYEILREIKIFLWRLKLLIESYYYDKWLGEIETIQTTEDISRFKATSPRFIKSSCQPLPKFIKKSYQPTPYNVLKKMLNYLKLDSKDIFVDLGCGKGRVIFFIATQRIKKVVGIEIDRALIDITRANFHKLRLRKTPIQIIDDDVVNLDATEGTIFFMFNPFDDKTFSRVLLDVKKSLIANPRGVRIVYYNPLYKDLLDSQDWLEFEGEIDKTRVFVWHNRL